MVTVPASEISTKARAHFYFATESHTSQCPKRLKLLQPSAGLHAIVTRLQDVIEVQIAHIVVERVYQLRAYSVCTKHTLSLVVGTTGLEERVKPSYSCKDDP